MLPTEYEAMHRMELSHWWYRGRRRLLAALLRQAAGARAGSLQILDYGCGTGGNTHTYASLGSVVGLEPDGFAIRVAHARGGACYCRGNGIRVPFRAGTFDVVVASDVLEHIEDDSTAIAEIVRVVKPGGSIVITVPAHQWLYSNHDAALHHFRRYSKASLRKVLIEGGLRIRRISYWNATLFPMICFYRLLQRQRRGELLRSDTKSVPRFFNDALTALLAGETTLFHHLTLPWGLSLVVVGERCHGIPNTAA